MAKSDTKKKVNRTLSRVSTPAAATDTLLDLIERFGLVDLVIGRVKSRIEETDIDELFDELSAYMKRNPEVLVVSLGALTVAAGMVVYLNGRREWDGEDRRRGPSSTPAPSSGASKIRRAS